MLRRIQMMDPSGRISDLDPSQSSAMRAASAGTTFYGGTFWAADSQRWEAYKDQLWTFDTGVGSSIVPPGGPGELSEPTASWINPHKRPGLHATMEGWIGWDNTYSEIKYFRRVASTDPRFGTVKCTGSAAGLGGTYSYWCGVFPAESQALCYASGQGYGNAWNVCIQHDFAYSGGSVTLAFQYKNDTEDGYDYTHVYVDTSSSGKYVEVVSYTGSLSGNATFPLTQGAELPSIPKPILIKFCMASDGAWSDQDGLNPTACGAFAVDNISITGAITHTADFETSDDGWTLSPPAPGLGGEWANIYHLNDLPAPLTVCSCALFDSVLALFDDNNQHNNYQDNLAASPWIDLKGYGAIGATGKIIKFNWYAELPLRNYIFWQANAQWYPEKCLQNGKLVTSAWSSNGFPCWYGCPVGCTPTTPGTIGTQIDFSGFIPAGAEQVRIALGVLSYCRFFANCTQTANTTPWYDEVGLGVYGNPGVPYIFADGIDRGQDNFPQNGGLQANAPGRIDCNNIQGDSQPEVGTTMGDTMIVTGAVGYAEVYVHYKVRPGPGINVANLNAWNNQHAVSGIDASYRRARLDTAEVGASGPLSGNWMTCYHEEDPNFAAHGVNDRSKDPTDITPTGGGWRLSHDIFPDNLFTAGTRIDYFFSANNVGSGVSVVDPASAPGTPYEVEILPSSFAANNTFNCTLYVDHFNRGAQGYIEAGLGTILGFGSNNVENTKWDRYDVNAESSQQGSFGRPLQTDYGATVVQTLGYKNILWDSGNLNAFTLTKEDADVLLPWLTLTGLGEHNLYLSGDGIVFSPISEGASEPSARRLIQDIAGITINTNCSNGTFRNANCPTAGASLDLTPCVNLDPVAGSLVSDRPPRSVGHLGQGNGCPQLRSFDVLSLGTPEAGAVIGDEDYSSPVKSASYASAAMTAPRRYRIVADGLSVSERRDAGGPCDYVLGGTTSVTERLNEVLTYFRYFNPSNSFCTNPTTGVGIPSEGPQPPKFTTQLGEFSPNPFAAGAEGRVRFTLAKDAAARVEIFDLQGRLMNTIFNGSAKMGDNQARWDGRDGSGNYVANGVYFYRFRALDQDQTRKLVIVSGRN